MAQKITLNVPLNRIEGDLEIRVELDDGVVCDAWSSGTMYRGFEQIMIGRGALDGLVITPRVCGICGTSHLTAASRALDMIARATPPPNAVRIRNVALMTEHIHSHLRQSFLMFTADFTNPAYRHLDLYDEAVTRYEPFHGETILDVIKNTKRVLEIVAVIGGQWPHSSYMVPGGIVSMLSTGDLLQCLLILREYRRWYERRILGCSLERWQEIQCAEDLERWFEEQPSHRESDLGFFMRFARQIGLDTIGRGYDNFLSYGAFDLPEQTQIQSLNRRSELIQEGNGHFIPAGFARGLQVDAFHQTCVAEHVAHSWFVDYEGGKHPFDGETQPYASGEEHEKYSWAKAPRYADLPAETGPLAEKIIAGDPLFCDLFQRHGPNAFIRQLARLVKSVDLIPAMETWLIESSQEGKFYVSPGKIEAGEGFGLTEGARGALGHWVRIQDGTITHYQIVTPTAWNASPRDSQSIRGPWEEALIGTPIKDPENPVELGHIVRSFDACLVCTVHILRHGQRRHTMTIGEFQ